MAIKHISLREYNFIRCSIPLNEGGSLEMLFLAIAVNVFVRLCTVLGGFHL